jgi:hypothetical protein
MNYSQWVIVWQSRHVYICSHSLSRTSTHGSSAFVSFDHCSPTPWLYTQFELWVSCCLVHWLDVDHLVTVPLFRQWLWIRFHSLNRSRSTTTVVSDQTVQVASGGPEWSLILTPLVPPTIIAWDQAAPDATPREDSRRCCRPGRLCINATRSEGGCQWVCTSMHFSWSLLTRRLRFSPVQHRFRTRICLWLGHRIILSPSLHTDALCTLAVSVERERRGRTN